MAQENTTGYNIFSGRTQRMGSRGEDVRATQRQLNTVNQGKLGWEPLEEDGIYGPKTKAAVQAYQFHNGNLGADGIVGQKTGPKLAVQAGYMSSAPKATDASNFEMPNPNEKQDNAVRPDVPQPIQNDVDKGVAAPKTAPEQNGIDYMNSLFTTPEQEEKMRKASVAKRRILAIGDALRHLGNVYYTTKGAVPQKFNSPVTDEEARYKQEKAERDANNQRVLSYREMKAKQEEDKRRWEAGMKQKDDQFKLNFQYTAARDAAKLAENARQADNNLAFKQAESKKQADQFDRTYKQRERQHRASVGLGYANLNETKRHHKEMEGKEKGSHLLLKTPYGQMSMSGRSIPQAQLNQAYKDFEKAGWIKQGEFQRRMKELGFGAKADPDYVRNRIVEEIISENGDASDYMRDNFGGSYVNDIRGTGQMLQPQQPQQSQYLGYTPDWRGGKNLGLGIGTGTTNNSKNLGLGL